MYVAKSHKETSLSGMKKEWETNVASVFLAGLLRTESRLPRLESRESNTARMMHIVTRRPISNAKITFPNIINIDITSILFDSCPRKSEKRFTRRTLITTRKQNCSRRSADNAASSIITISPVSRFTTAIAATTSGFMNSVLRTRNHQKRNKTRALCCHSSFFIISLAMFISCVLLQSTQLT